MGTTCVTLVSRSSRVGAMRIFQTQATRPSSNGCSFYTVAGSAPREPTMACFAAAAIAAYPRGLGWQLSQVMGHGSVPCL